MMSGIYIHIPFCKQACHYCDFYFSTAIQRKGDFVKALLMEMEIRKDYLGADAKIESVYFGGGTPSLLDKRELDLIFSQLNKYFSVNADAEITLEANPDDLTAEKLAALAGTAVNRLSIGIQSFFNDELKWMNRAHDAAMAENSVREAQEAGFNNISIDLIYGSPLLTNDRWCKNLQQVFSLDVQHLSCYNLTIEKSTALAAMIEKGKATGPDENTSSIQFQTLMELSAQYGFEQYEISNFCRNEYYSKHNSSYWKGISYIGLGPSAHSFNTHSRQWNKADNRLYIMEIEKGNVPFDLEVLKNNDKYNEYIMTSLRTKWGVSMEYMAGKLGQKYVDYFLEKIKKPMLENQVEKQDNIFVLTTAGKFFADRIAADLFYLEKSNE